MREILFRGKRVDNGEWIEGFYVETLDIKNEDVLPPFVKKKYIFTSWEESLLNNDDNGGVYEVIPETIGQYTGLTDKNGVKIFDGDMFKPDECNEEVKSVVRYDDEFAKFVIDSYGFDFHIGEGSQEVFDNEISICDTYDLGDMILEQCEIIGNIHDK